MTPLERAFPTVAKLIERRRASNSTGSTGAATAPGRTPAPPNPVAAEGPPSPAGNDADHAGGRRRRPRGPKVTGQRRRAPTVVGLDIDANHIVAAQVRVDGSIAVERAAGAPLGPEIVRDGEVVDVEALATALRTLFTEHKLDRRVRVGLANQQVMVRTIELPPIDDARELEAAVRFKAQDEIPMPLESVVLDFRSLGVFPTDSGPRQRIMLVAARRDMVERLISAVTAAGLRPEGVDLAAFALIRALSPAPLHSSERILYLSVGGLTNLVVAEGSTCVFTRVLNVGLESMTATVAERCVIPTLEARGLLLEDDPLLAPDAGPAIDPAPAPAADENSEIAREVLQAGVRQIAADARNSLDFHFALGPGSAVTNVIASGPALEIPGFRELLASELGLPVALGEITESRSGAAGAVPLSRLSVAAGLAVAERPA